jgi:hypothetical protein
VVLPTEHARQEVVAALRPLIAAVDAAASDLDEAEQGAVVRFLSAAAARLSTAAGELARTDAPQAGA